MENNKKSKVILFLLAIGLVIFVFWGTEYEKGRLDNKVKQEKKEKNKTTRNDLLNIKYIYQNEDKYKKYKCDPKGAYLKDDFKIHGCMLFNYVMVNNVLNDKKTSIEQLDKEGYDCHFDYKKAAKEYDYSQYEFIDLKDKYVTDMSHKYKNMNNIIENGKDDFTFKEALDKGIPLMVWVIPKKDKELDEGHLITIYKYTEKNGKIEYYFYDTFNKKTPSRKLSEFMERWKIAQIHILKK